MGPGEIETLDRQQREIVGEPASGEGVDGLDHFLQKPLWVETVTSPEEIEQTRLAEQGLTLSRLDQPVGVQQHHVFGVQVGLGVRERHIEEASVHRRVRWQLRHVVGAP